MDVEGAIGEQHPIDTLGNDFEGRGDAANERVSADRWDRFQPRRSRSIRTSRSLINFC